MEQSGKVRFVRIHGKIVPIRSKKTTYGDVARTGVKVAAQGGAMIGLSAALPKIVGRLRFKSLGRDLRTLTNRGLTHGTQAATVLAKRNALERVAKTAKYTRIGQAALGFTGGYALGVGGALIVAGALGHLFKKKKK